MIASGGKTWFSAAELAELALPGLPRSKRKVNELAEGGRWALATDDRGQPLARPRGGRGGGLEYHQSLLPAAAKAALLKAGIGPAEVSLAPPAAIGASLWPWYEAQSDKTKAEAQRRARIVTEVETFESGGLTRSAAVALAAANGGASPSTIWLWLQAIAGVDPNDRLPHLAPRRRGGGVEAAIDDTAWQLLVSDYLRPEQPTFSSCYYRLKRDYAAPRGIDLPCERTLWRRIERLDQRLVVARRQGADALRATMPAQQRTVAQLHALELVNIDGHRWDVFVRFPDGVVRRPVMVAIQDVYSRKILSWRIGESEDAVQTRLAFADLFERYGIPKGCLLDNGRAFASKAITGGAKTRFRFKIREDDTNGLLTSLNIRVHWALPFRGSSKPIERGFRDLCDAVAKHPAFAGAYTGNRPDAKPENYGDRAIPLDEFVRIASAGIVAHNEKPGRRTEMARGNRSFDEVFAASYAAAPIGKATVEQLRLALLTADDRPTNRRTGEIELLGNRYWSAELSQIAGQRVTVRFDPDDLGKPLHVYTRDGAFLAEAPQIAATGFLDLAAAKQRARREADLRRSVKKLIEAERLLEADQVAALIPAAPDEAELPEPAVIRPVRHRARGAAARAVAEAAHAPLNQPVIDRIAAAASARLRLVDND